MELEYPDASIDAERIQERSEIYARARIKSEGKMTGRGPSFTQYLQIVNGTLDSYAATILALESRFWLEMGGGEREGLTEITLKGEPFCIEFSRCIDVNALARRMFDCKRPFRLMAEPRNLEDDYVVCDAIDLHVNQPVGFELGDIQHSWKSHSAN